MLLATSVFCTFLSCTEEKYRSETVKDLCGCTSVRIDEPSERFRWTLCPLQIAVVVALVHGALHVSIQSAFAPLKHILNVARQMSYAF